MNSRDDFNARTKELLAKRVGFKCSNPRCKKQTIAANSKPQKTISIGVAAHIKAAAPGGKRYDADMTQEQRSDIENGIWLCQNCAALIDRDDAFTVETLNEWKSIAENETYQALLATNANGKKMQQPYLDAELIWHSAFRRSFGVSPLTPQGEIHIMDAIWVFRISWTYILKLYNTSSLPLFNVKIHPHTSNNPELEIDPIPNVNNIQPFREMELKAETFRDIHCQGQEAEAIMRPKYPEHILGLRYLIEYIREDRSVFYTEITINKNMVENKYLIEKPEGYEN